MFDVVRIDFGSLNFFVFIIGLWFWGVVVGFKCIYEVGCIGDFFFICDFDV